jgi:hypothetical protein
MGRYRVGRARSRLMVRRLFLVEHGDAQLFGSVGMLRGGLADGCDLGEVGDHLGVLVVDLVAAREDVVGCVESG